MIKKIVLARQSILLLKTQNNNKETLLENEEIDFKKHRDFNIIVSILQKEKKNQQEVQLLKKAFSTFKFFQDLSSEMEEERLQTLYKQLIYEEMQPRNTVFNFGDIGQKFYIIMRGSVFVKNLKIYQKSKQVLVKKKGLQDEDQQLNQEVNQTKKMKNSKKNELQENEQDDLSKYDKLNDTKFLAEKFPDMIQVGILNVGNSFRELALTKGAPRAATIICKEKTHFVTLSREKFNKFLCNQSDYFLEFKAEFYKAQQEVNIQFLKRISFFCEWNDQMLNQLYYHFTFQDFTMNQVIYKENDIAEQIYFNIFLQSKIYLIYSGEIEVSKIVFIQHTMETESQKLLHNFVDKVEKYTSKQQRIKVISQIFYQKVSLINQGQIFGEEEILRDLIKREQMAVCVSEKVKLFVLEKSRFTSFCSKGNTIQQINESNLKKGKWRSINEANAISFAKPKFLRSPEKINQSQKQFLITTNSIIRDKEYTSVFDKLDNLTHRNSMMLHFEKKFYNFGKTSPNECLGRGAYFDLSANKGEIINIMKKQIVPGQMRQTFEIPTKFGKTQTHLIKTLKLSKVLKSVKSEKKLYQVKSQVEEIQYKNKNIQMNTQIQEDNFY